MDAYDDRTGRFADVGRTGGHGRGRPIRGSRRNAIAPALLDLDGPYVRPPASSTPDGESEFVGYTLAIPEVGDLGRVLRSLQELAARQTRRQGELCSARRQGAVDRTAPSRGRWSSSITSTGWPPRRSSQPSRPRGIHRGHRILPHGRGREECQAPRPMGESRSRRAYWSFMVKSARVRQFWIRRREAPGTAPHPSPGSPKTRPADPRARNGRTSSTPRRNARGPRRP